MIFLWYWWFCCWTNYKKNIKVPTTQLMICIWQTTDMLFGSCNAFSLVKMTEYHPKKSYLHKLFQRHICKIKFYQSGDNFTQALLVMLVCDKYHAFCRFLGEWVFGSPSFLWWAEQDKCQRWSRESNELSIASPEKNPPFLWLTICQELCSLLWLGIVGRGGWSAQICPQLKSGPRYKTLLDTTSTLCPAARAPTNNPRSLCKIKFSSGF